MSKRQTNTLFNYFQSPKTPKKEASSPASTPKANTKVEENTATTTPKGTVSGKNKSSTPKANTKVEKNTATTTPKGTVNGKNKSDTNGKDNSKETPKLVNSNYRNAKPASDSEDEVVNKRKRSRTSDDSSDSGNESPKKPILKKKKPINKILDSDDELETSKTNIKEFSFKKSSSERTQDSMGTSYTAPKEFKEKEVVTSAADNWVHNKLPFLKPDKIMDANRRKADHPDYDPTTLYVPDSYLKELTPAMRQWWELKSQNFDSVLFFKVGKFYELYHMDATVGVQHLGFSYMKGEFAHSGFPETAFSKMANILMDKGFKVARVEQTETPEMMAARCKTMLKPTKFDKVVKRETCQVSNKASLVCTAQMPEPWNQSPYYLYAICTRQDRIGVCFIETTIGSFHLSEFVDDKSLSRLLALFAEYPPALILIERGNTIKALDEILNTQYKDVEKNRLLPSNQFLTAADTLEKLSMACYFRDKEGSFHWPEFFKKIADDCLPKSEYELVIRSLGACLWYFTKSQIDIQIFTDAKFVWYDPLDCIQSSKKTSKEYLILDAVTVSNLNLLGPKGSLMSVLNHCDTPFGKRLLQRWLCRPLCDVDKITERQNAVSVLWKNPSLLKNVKGLLKKLPDFERDLTKIHTYGNRFYAKEHPDSRAIFYEAAAYSKRKIQDFLKTLKSFEVAQELPAFFSDCEDNFLKKITQFQPDGMNVDLTETLDFFKTAFDQEQAQREGKIIPKAGVVEDYDMVENKIQEINKELEEYLEEQSRFFGCKVSYFGTDKKRFQLEVPEHKCNRATSEYQLEGVKKGAKPTKRYTTETTKQLLADMMKAEAEKAKVVLDLNRCIFEKFSEKRDQFEQVVHCLKILDVLCSLAEYARTYTQDICVPEILPFTDMPRIVIQNGCYPCTQNVESFVTNDTRMGVDGHPPLLIITGPNMGGKSTLMRQIATISIMAQIGSLVPASSCEITLIDRIFTRLGAQDDLIKGHSTFYNELSEASSILQHSTNQSLVIIDELGRGTSTHDGNAIATAYVKKMITIGCRTMFSTHYHSLVDHFINRKDVQLGHMACMAENDDDASEESVIFLYKLAEGRCPKSYGFNAARLAGLDPQIVRRAREKASELEQEHKFRTAFAMLFRSNVSEIRKVLLSLNLNSH